VFNFKLLPYFEKAVTSTSSATAFWKMHAIQLQVSGAKPRSNPNVALVFNFYRVLHFDRGLLSLPKCSIQAFY